MPSPPCSVDTLREVPVRHGLPLVGDSFQYLRHGDRFIQWLYARYGEACRVDAFGTRIHFLLGPEANRFVLQNQDRNFTNARWSYFIGPFFRRGLMLLDFDEHRAHRRIMQAAFTREALEGYLAPMQARIERDLGRWRPGNGFGMFAALKAMTLNIGSEVFCGRAPGPEADSLNHAFLATVRAGTGLIRFGLPGTRWHAGLRARRVLERHFRESLPQRRLQGGDDLYARLCLATDEEGRPYSDEDVINHMIFVLMAAHDTSTITLSNAIYQLARAPEWQARLREECRALGERPTLDDYARLESMEWVLKETLRMTAPVPILPRGVLRECEFQGMRIPAGATVSISPWLAHYLPGCWDRPQRFEPDRFSPARAEDRRHPFQWIPFGGGAHKCIGLHFGMLEVKAVLHAMLLRFDWSVPADYRMPQDFTSLPIPKDGLPLRLERRDVAAAR